MCYRGVGCVTGVRGVLHGCEGVCYRGEGCVTCGVRGVLQR